MKWRDNIYQIFNFLNFPLVLLVAFLRCKEEPSDLHTNWLYFVINDAYNFFRSYISYILCIVAVPNFFLMSNYLFYNNIVEQSYDLYFGKIRRRLKTLIIPYVSWITIYLAGNFFNRLAKTLFVVYAVQIVFILKYVRIYIHQLLESEGDNCVFLLVVYFIVPLLAAGSCVLFNFIVNRFCPKLLVI